MSKKDIDHFTTNAKTPLREDAFVLTDEEKINRLEKNVFEMMHTLGMDMTDDSLKDTPGRVAKMWVKEIFVGLHPENRTKISVFENKYKYGEMLIEKNIGVYSTCEHHLLPVIGKAHIAYISTGTVIGLSKLNRIVRHYAKRPQVQERMTKQIVEDLKQVLHTEDVACIIDAKHFCVITRGIEDVNSSTITAEFGGKFKNSEVKKEFLDLLNLKTEIDVNI
jgi:GTP cyclohydrolase I